jgi:hypothetical protein
MKRLNFFPYYEGLLRERLKTTTFRVGSRPPYTTGEPVMLTIGWRDDEAVELHGVRVTDIYQRKVKDLQPRDFEGESPDCRDPAATRLVLSAIYRTVVLEDDDIWIVKFEHV